MTAWFESDGIPYDERLFPPVFMQSYLQLQKSLGFQTIIAGDSQGAFAPLAVKKKYSFKIGRFLYKPVKASGELNQNEEKLFLEEMKILLAKKNLADALLAPLHICVFHGLPDAALASPLGIIRIDLKNRTEEEVFSKFQPRYRTVIRKSERDKVRIEFGMHVFDDFCRLYRETQSREGAIGDTREIIMKMERVLGNNHIQCGVAYVDNKPDAALFNIYNSLEAYYLYGGTASPTLHDGSFKLLQWEAMRQLLRKKVGRYCLGGARRGKVEGTKFQRIIEFKMRFGAEIEEGYHIIMPITAKYGLYQKLMKVYLRLRGVKDQSDTMPFKPVSSFKPA